VDSNKLPGMPCPAPGQVGYPFSDPSRLKQSDRIGLPCCIVAPNDDGSNWPE